MSSMPSSLDTAAWDSYGTRMTRYRLYANYDSNRVYFDPHQLLRIQIMRPALYKHIRGIYNPVNRLNRLYVAKVYGGALDWELLRDGAIPVDQADDRLRAALKQLWLWSNWQRGKNLFVRFGSVFGDSALKVVDDVEAQKIRLEVLDPRKIQDVEVDGVGNVKNVVIEYERTDFGGNKPYRYTEIITGEEFVTLKDGEEFPFYADAAGNPVSRWKNEYGFVPVALAQHRATDAVWGDVAFSDFLTKIDEVNDQASLINDQIRKIIVPILLMSGVQKNDQLEVRAGDRDGLSIIQAGQGAQAFPLTGNLQLADASANLKDMLGELENDLPELKLARMLETGEVTATAIRAAASAGVARIVEAQGNYDECLVRAQMMATSIGGYRGYKEFGGFSLDSYARGDLQHYIRTRPVIPDDLTKLEKIQATQAAGASMELQLREIGYDEETIEEEAERASERSANAVRAFGESLFGEDVDTDSEASDSVEGGDDGEEATAQ
jgi:hypothetical protein